MRLLLIKAMDIDARLKALKERRGETDEQFDAMLARATRDRPTESQAEAGNYFKPRIKWQGLEIAIENPAGTVREGKGWRITMANHYGYITRSEAVDGDEVDVYLGPNMDAPTVYVVHQRKYGDWEKYDEDKCMLGFDSESEARAAYLKHYDDKRFLGPITAMPVAEFVAKVKATRERPAMIKAEDLRKLIKEHKRLVAVLRSPSHEDDKDEADRQAAELSEYRERDSAGDERGRVGGAER